MFILLGMPIVQIIIFGFALTNEVKNSEIAILDQSKDAATSQLITEINASRYFNVNCICCIILMKLQKHFRPGKAKIVLVFPPNFSNDLKHLNTAQVQLIADAS